MQLSPWLPTYGKSQGFAMTPRSLTPWPLQLHSCCHVPWALLISSLPRTHQVSSQLWILGVIVLLPQIFRLTQWPFSKRPSSTTHLKPHSFPNTLCPPALIFLHRIYHSILFCCKLMKQWKLNNNNHHYPSSHSSLLALPLHTEQLLSSPHSGYIMDRAQCKRKIWGERGQDTLFNQSIGIKCH